MRVNLRSVVEVAFGFIIGGLMVFTWLWSPPDPIEIYDAWIVEATADRLTIGIKIDWNVYCDVVADRFVFREFDKDKVIVWRQASVPLAFNNGAHQWVGTFDFVPSLKPDKYVFRSRWTCSGKGRTYSVAIPDLPFEVK